MCIVSMRLPWLHDTCWWKRGSPQPRSLPNGNLRGSLPQDLWQVWDEIEEGKRKMKMKEKIVVEGWCGSFIVEGVEGEINKIVEERMRSETLKWNAI